MDNQLKANLKTIKVKEKEYHNMEKKLLNNQDTISNIRFQKNKAENDVKRLERKLKKCDSKTKRESISCQTSSSVDLPYSVTEALPPIFSSQLCVQSKPIFMSKSLPDLATLIFVEDTEETRIRDAAEEALNAQYDRKVARYYDDAISKAAALQRVYDDGDIRHLFEPQDGW